MNSFRSQAKRLREQMAEDPHRPHYHFLPPSNWMNDPNGVIEWNGQYHLFYQHNPNHPFWDNMHWGHAVSDDLVHWVDLPIALTPSTSGADEAGCWSGCTVNNNGVPTILYTGVKGDFRLPHNQRICIATSTNDLVLWEKYTGNPVISHPPDGLNVTGFRDPYVWQEGQVWYMAIGSGIQDIGGAVLLYRSKDLYGWEYMHPLCVGDKHETSTLWTGSVWEVPQFFRLGDKYVLIVTVWDNDQTLYSAYFTGSYRDHHFIPEAVHKLDFGNQHFCAPHTMIDSQGLPIMWGWIGESRSNEAQKAAGWAGVMSLPRALSLSDDGKLGVCPVQAVETLRGEHQRLTNIELSPTSSDYLIDIRGNTFEIIAEIDPSKALNCGIKLCCSPNSEEETYIFYDAVRKRLGVDRRRSKILQDGEKSHDVQEGEFDVPPGETLCLRVFIDCSVIEVYANNSACITSRVYPSRSDSTRVGVFAQGQARINSIDIWRLTSIWVSS